MSEEELLHTLDKAEQSVRLFTNMRKEPRLLNRVRKFAAHPVRYAYENAYKLGLGLSPERRVSMFWGGAMTLPLSDSNSVLAYYCGALGPAECRLARFCIRTVKPGDVCYDIGAHFGFYSALLGALGAEVHAFEPNPSSARYLRANALHAAITEAAVADAAGEREFTDVTASRKSAMSTLFPDTLPEENRRAGRTIVVKTITLDDYIQTHPVPVFIKLDAENAESLVLSGGRALFTTHAPVLAMEVYDAPAALERTRAALALLREYGYRSYKINKEGAAEPHDIVLGQVGGLSNFVFKK